MLIVDSREKPKAIARILKYMQESGVEYMTSKLIVGDYMIFKRPDRIIDRKQNILELAKNCTSDHVRFKAELETAQNLGVELVILVEQDRYRDGERIIMVRDISDLMLWTNPHTQVKGEKVYRILASWCNKYPIRVEFCRSCDTGRRIMEILEDE